MLCRVALIVTDVSEELSTSIIRVTRIGKLGNTWYYLIFLINMFWLLVMANIVLSSPILVTLVMEALRSSVTSVLTRATPRNIPEDGLQVPKMLPSPPCASLQTSEHLVMDNDIR
jgi:hypothetical protein